MHINWVVLVYSDFNKEYKYFIVSRVKVDIEGGCAAVKPLTRSRINWLRNQPLMNIIYY